MTAILGLVLTILTSLILNPEIATARIAGSYIWKDNVCYNVIDNATLVPLSFREALNGKTCEKIDPTNASQIVNAYYILGIDNTAYDREIGSYFWKNNNCYFVGPNRQAVLVHINTALGYLNNACQNDFSRGIEDEDGTAWLKPDVNKVQDREIKAQVTDAFWNLYGNNAHKIDYSQLLDVEESMKQKKIMTKYLWKDNLCQRLNLSAEYEVASFRRATDGTACDKLPDYSEVRSAYEKYYKLWERNTQIFTTVSKWELGKCNTNLLRNRNGVLSNPIVQKTLKVGEISFSRACSASGAICENFHNATVTYQCLDQSIPKLMAD